jgi:AcrR family transcriptional regulator
MSLPTVRQTQHERRSGTRRALVSAAAGLFAELGYDAVSVDAVAQAAGRTSGAVYDHFGSKQGLLLAVLDDFSDSLVSAVTSAFDGAPDLRQRLRAVAAQVVVAPSDDTRRMLLLEHEFALHAVRDPLVADAVHRRGERLRARLVRGLARWKAEGVLPADSLPAEDLAAIVTALVLGMHMQERLAPGTFDVEQAAAVLEAAMTTVPDRTDRPALATRR